VIAVAAVPVPGMAAVVVVRVPVRCRIMPVAGGVVAAVGAVVVPRVVVLLVGLLGVVVLLVGLLGVVVLLVGLLGVVVLLVGLLGVVVLLVGLLGVLVLLVAAVVGLLRVVVGADVVAVLAAHDAKLYPQGV
jgi:hypothetical protein